MTKNITTTKEMMAELEKLEPKNIIDYIFKGSALTQYLKIHKIRPYKNGKEFK